MQDECRLHTKKPNIMLPVHFSSTNGCFFLALYLSFPCHGPGQLVMVVIKISSLFSCYCYHHFEGMKHYTERERCCGCVFLDLINQLLRFLVQQNTALFSTFLRSFVLRHRRDILTFFDILTVYTMKTIYFLNAYHPGW